MQRDAAVEARRAFAVRDDRSSREIGVVGGGTMGAGIAEVAARAGHSVWMFDIDDAAIARGVSNLTSSVERAVARGKISSAQGPRIIQAVRPTRELADLARCELVIEAVPETLDLKRAVLGRLGDLVAPDALLASNTSSLSISEIATAVSHPDRVVGMHFFNPAPVLPLVELISGEMTSAGSMERAQAFVHDFGKRGVRSGDAPGFIVNRVARLFYLEALRIVGDGYAGIVDVDSAFRSNGFKMGPFELMDLIGIDVNLAVTRSLFEQTHHEPRFRPSYLQESLVRAGRHGRKTGAGFYTYTNGDSVPVVERAARATLPEGPWREWGRSELEGFILARGLCGVINEANWVVAQGVSVRADVDVAMRLGMNWPAGPFEWAAERGSKLVAETLRVLRRSFGDAYLAAPVVTPT